MADKVRRVDWSPDEWLSGVTGVLTVDEVAVYITVINLIYSRGGECPFDATYIGGLFKPKRSHHKGALGQTARVEQALDQLVKLGKLKVLRSSNGDRWLTNGRATSELGKARGRITSAARAGIASGEARRRRAPSKSPAGAPQQPRASPSTGQKSSADNDLARTAVRNHQPSTIKSDREISTEAPRASGSAVEAPAARALGSGPRKMGDVVADLARKRRGSP
jgi:hypothetical protein